MNKPPNSNTSKARTTRTTQTIRTTRTTRTTQTTRTMGSTKTQVWLRGHKCGYEDTSVATETPRGYINRATHPFGAFELYLLYPFRIKQTTNEAVLVWNTVVQITTFWCQNLTSPRMSDQKR